ncbi:hypothetical protein CONCODRAFT_141853 [Conidiobolus coronatus NRRL 28638]|uniref:Spt20-like SEP domain-containing protein n=1 Tax=Conidiobolus coronatus (strain ATCC 28846 / CBS 209.66 / NRRL 28638) TaxID=796925 RepID=A0A137PAB5_CONC2|nr:hypothetical protein CONCODRAFT_141853 [Conidiobolus coronatus NRRL 28638]|eukprot:KXN71953.1 hypothetical protein CONCODRAFT_141853 [Conidiobolus coronatus NRRL 28638]
MNLNLEFYTLHLDSTGRGSFIIKKPILKVHVFATHLKFEGQPGTSSLDGPLKNFVECLDNRELPATLLDIFDASNYLYIKGCLVVDMIDYRSSPKNDRGVNSRIYLQPTSKSIWADVCRLQSQTGMPFDEDKALEIESELLLTIEPELDLTPNPTASTISNMLHYRETVQQKNAKRPHSALQSEAQKSDQQEFSKLMRLMDDDRYNTSFSPSFDLIKYLKQYRSNKQNEDSIPSLACDSKTTNGYQPLPPGYNIIRSIRFKKEMTQGKELLLFQYIVY